MTTAMRFVIQGNSSTSQMINRNVSIILPVINETFSLENTVQIIMDENKETVKEILIMIASRTTDESRKAIQELEKDYPSIIKVYTQNLPYLGGAIRDAFRRVTGDWVIMMASDLETDPRTVKKLIMEAGTGNWDIVTATRWRDKGRFHSYNSIKLIFNFLFQNIFKLLYHTRLTDLTFGFRIFRTDLIKKIRWQELKHPFLFETIIKPLRLGCRIKEIPSSWEARQEGESQNTFMANFAYLRIGLKVLFSRKENLLNS